MEDNIYLHIQLKEVQSKQIEALHFIKLQVQQKLKPYTQEQWSRPKSEGANIDSEIYSMEYEVCNKYKFYPWRSGGFPQEKYLKLFYYDFANKLSGCLQLL